MHTCVQPNIEIYQTPSHKITMDCNKTMEKTSDDIIIASDKVPKPIQESPFQREYSAIKGHITRMSVNFKRVIPHCFRTICKDAHFRHRITCKNTKHRKNQNNKRKEININHNTNISGDIVHSSISLDSPITIKSSSYDEISSQSLTSDSDDIDMLIKKTKARLNNKKEILSDMPLIACTESPIIRRDDGSLDNDGRKTNDSLNSMETVVLQSDSNNVAYSPTMSPCAVDDSTNISPVISPISSIRFNINDINDLPEKHSLSNTPSPECNIWSMKKLQNIPCHTSESGDISPLYEISGKSFMEHYLNKNIY